MTTRTGSTLLILIALVAAETVAILETTMSIQLLRAPEGFFNVPLASMTWILTAYTLAAGIAAAIGSRLGDIFGRRNVLAGALALGGVGSLLSAVAPEFWILVAGRAIQGSAGVVLPLAIGVVSATFPRERIASAVTIVSSSAIISGALGILVGGMVLSAFNWHAIYWITAVAALLVAGLVLAWVPKDPKETLDKTAKVDFLGAFLIAVGLGGTLFALTSGANSGWLSPVVVVSGVTGAVFLVLFVLWQMRVTHPLFELSTLRNRNVRNAMIMSVLLGFGPLGMYTALAASLHRQPSSLEGVVFGVGIGVDPVMYGMLSAISAAIGFGMASLFGRIADKRGAWSILALGCLICIGALGVHLIGPASFWFVVIAAAVFTVGSTCLFSGVPALVVESVDQKMVSVTAAMAQNIRNVFQSVGTAVLGVLLSVGSITVGETEFITFPGLSAAVVAIVVPTAIVLLLTLGSKRLVAAKVSSDPAVAEEPGLRVAES